MEEMSRFDVSVTTASAGVASRTFKIEVLAKNSIEASIAGAQRSGAADRVCIIVKKTANQAGSAMLEFTTTLAIAACWAGLVFTLPIDQLFSPSIEMLNNLNQKMERAA